MKLYEEDIIKTKRLVERNESFIIDNYNHKDVNIAAKSFLDEKQLSDRIKKGANLVEIHLNKNTFKDYTIDEAVDIVKKSGLIPVNVHLPFGPNNEVHILSNKDTEEFENIKKCIKFTDKLGKEFDTILNLVMHAAVKYNTDINSIENIKLNLEELLNDYDFYLNLENSMLYKYNDKDGTYYRHTTCFIDTVELTHILKINSAYPDRIRMTFDLCHLLSDLRVIYGEDVNVIPYIENTLYKLSNLVGVFHIANARGTGYKNVDHGVNFESKEDIEILKRSLDAYKHFNQDIENSQLVLEILEEDYYDTKNYTKMLKLIRTL